PAYFLLVTALLQKSLNGAEAWIRTQDCKTFLLAQAFTPGAKEQPYRLSPVYWAFRQPRKRGWAGYFLQKVPRRKRLGWVKFTNSKVLLQQSHRRITFRDEYRSFLKKYGIEYNER